MIAGYASFWSEPLELLNDAAESLGEAERRLTETLTEDYPHSLLRSSSEILEAAGACHRDLHRLLSTAGFRDLGELHARVTERLNSQLRSPTERFQTRLRPAARAGLVQRMAEHEAAGVTATLAYLDDSGALELAASSILAARRRFVIGEGKSSAFAQILAADLGSVLSNVCLLGDADRRLDALTDAGANDLAIAVSLRRYDRMTVQLTESLARRGASVIAVTDSQDAPLASTADLALVACTRSTSFVDSPTAVVAVLHALATLVAARSKAAQRRLERREEAHRLLDHYVRP
ncbi:MurR/RpiR family transcriptional regulator [Streptomyces sp. NPDC058701]|uniref:MurR/RpiR family transcriptional regulator n=1 Tax=Streptomyces sp. NPDC058701 TaxID=3346608 RepID=UPI0036609F61